MLFIPGFLKKSGKRKKTKSPSSASSSGRFMMTLEPRYLYDAAGLIAGKAEPLDLRPAEHVVPEKAQKNLDIALRQHGG
mgnify:CR=1 FL=1